MGSMFANCVRFDSDLSLWNVANVLYMNSMFSNASSFTGRGLENWSVDNVQTMDSMFAGASNFQADLSGWNVQNVTDMGQMFQGCVLFNSDVSGWNVESNLNMYGMFSNASSFTGKGLDTWITSNVTNMTSMFANDLSNANFSTNLSSWNVTSVTNMSQMFQNCIRFDTDFSLWNVSSVANMNSMFSNASSFTGQGLSNWCISSLTRELPLFRTNTIVPTAENMLDYTNISKATYNGILNGWVSQRPYVPPDVHLGAAGLCYDVYGLNARNNLKFAFRWQIVGDTYCPPSICFHEDTKILTDKGYVKISKLQPGDNVQTASCGFQPIVRIGYVHVSNPDGDARISDRLFVYPKQGRVFEDVIVTGNHSVLVKAFHESERSRILEVLGNIYKTEGYIRLPAYADQRSRPYAKKGLYKVYNFALHHANADANYGVYANGLLMECTNSRHMRTYQVHS